MPLPASVGSGPPTPASCPIVLDRKEPGRELEPLQGQDHGRSRCLPEGVEGVGVVARGLPRSHTAPGLR